MTRTILATTACFALIFSLQSCKEGSSATGKQSIDGYDYYIHVKGDGAAIEQGQWVYFTLVMSDSNGKVYQENLTEPLPVAQVPLPGQEPNGPKAFLEMLGQSQVGDSLQFVMPRDSLVQLPPGTEPFDNLNYYVRIKKALNTEEYQAETAKVQAAEAEKAAVLQAQESEVAELVTSIAQSIDDGTADIKSDDSGVKYIIHEEGSGSKPQVGDQVSVMYYGTLENGEMFDNAYKRGSEFSFKIGEGQVIKGWDEGLQLLNEGAKATLIIPSELGYGDQDTPTIPANSTLRFYIELKSIN